jgi:hypothetical protein
MPFGSVVLVGHVGCDVDWCNEEFDGFSSETGKGLILMVSASAVLGLFSSCGLDRVSTFIVLEIISSVGDGKGSDAGPLVFGSVGELFVAGRERYD